MFLCFSKKNVNMFWLKKKNTHTHKKRPDLDMSSVQRNHVWGWLHWLVLQQATTPHWFSVIKNHHLPATCLLMIMNSMRRPMRVICIKMVYLNLIWFWNSYDNKESGMCENIKWNRLKTKIVFFFFFLFGFYGPFKNISLISSQSFIKGGRKPENLEKKKHLPSVSRTWLSNMWPEQGSNHSGEKPNGLRVNSPIH